MNKIIDFHLHPDTNRFSSAEECFNYIGEEFKKSNIEKGALLQLISQVWSRESVGEALKKAPFLFGFVSINPLEENCGQKLENYIMNYGYRGLKLHPRLDHFKVNDPKTVEIVKLAGQLNLPVVIDAFPDGTSIREGFEPKDYAELCNACPATRVIVAHFGGIKVLEFLLLGKRTPNMYFNVAYSLLYFRGSSITQDLVYAIQSLQGRRVFYGSDYPDREIGETLSLSLVEFKKFGLSEQILERVLYTNAKEFLEFYA